MEGLVKYFCEVIRSLLGAIPKVLPQGFCFHNYVKFRYNLKSFIELCG